MIPRRAAQASVHEPEGRKVRPSSNVSVVKECSPLEPVSLTLPGPDNQTTSLKTSPAGYIVLAVIAPLPDNQTLRGR